MSLLVRFCVLTKEGAAGFGFVPNIGPLRRLSPSPFGAISDPDGANGFVGVVGGPPDGSGGRAGSDIDGSLSEDASSDKVREVKVCKNPENFKNSEKRGSEACQGKGRRPLLI